MISHYKHTLGLHRVAGTQIPISCCPSRVRISRKSDWKQRSWTSKLVLQCGQLRSVGATAVLNTCPCALRYSFSFRMVTKIASALAWRANRVPARRCRLLSLLHAFLLPPHTGVPRTQLLDWLPRKREAGFSQGRGTLLSTRG